MWLEANQGFSLADLGEAVHCIVLKGKPFSSIVEFDIFCILLFSYNFVIFYTTPMRGTKSRSIDELMKYRINGKSLNFAGALSS